MHARPRGRFRWFAVTAFSVSLLGGCAIAPPAAHQGDRQENLAAFSAQLSGASEVPPVSSRGRGQIVAVLDRQTLLLRWKMSFSGLDSAATAAQLHGPAGAGRNARPIITFEAPPKSPLEGRATLTPEQASDLLSGQWYANVHTARHPSGEIRGQLLERR
jgi:hypothetical protein